MQNEDKAWIEWREKFSEVYDNANYSGSLQSLVMRASHQLVERSFDTQTHFRRVIEVGAGTGEHLQFVRHGFDEYTLSDLDPKPLEFAKSKLAGSSSRGKVTFEVQTGSELAYPDNTFDRLVATHVLEHIYQPYVSAPLFPRLTRGVVAIPDPVG